MPTWSDWSDWSVGQSENLMYRVRQDHQGNLDYEYNHGYGNRAETPRGDSETIEALAAQLDGLSPASNFDSQEYELNSGPQETPASLKSKAKDRDGERGKERERERERRRDKERDRTKDKNKDKTRDKTKDKTKEKSKEKTKEKTRDKGKHHQHDKSSLRKGHSQSVSTQQREGASVTASTELQSQTHYACDSQYSGRSEYSEPATTYAISSTGYYPHESRQVPQTVSQSQKMQYGTIPSGVEAPNAAAATTAYTTPTYEYEPEIEEDESSIPKGGAISADEDQFEAIDPRYRIEPSSRFQPGEIFKVYWSEPQGSGEHKHSNVSGRQEIQNKFGMKFFVGFRRFIVVANDQGHCTCVPILTYGGKACNKTGVKPAKHGIVYEYGHRARMLDGEPKLGFPAVQARITEEGERLSKESRVNYSKLVTVEHNVNVFFIGSIVPESWPLVEDAVNDCWRQKVHQRNN